ncbi:diacylglycerol kinase theta isoform X2 [Contarinia nasturtii]|uniref:diacylglycerol kinase theta isoform X2 n=1 Tax=Contarinia nasturtii TaxID=265458 RepID=UPI0012D3EA83|nr:diacylglycerol kinase theta isoform X2 [Contarinia nasturtii]
MADGGHSFGKKTFHKPTYCHHCSDLLWGLIGQGYICEVCNFIVHEKCIPSVVTPCSSVAPCIIKNPIAHCWSEPTHHKRKFCTVCRKRFDESPAVHCMICEYFAHVDCQDFAIPDCKENATYVPGKELSSVKHQHHWREGNLPQTSKCSYCRKSCWSTECLTGYRCEWCGMTTHSGCRSYISNDCTFGILQPIYLPPHAVSIPRTEVPMEAIIGVQVRSRSTPLQRDYSCPELRTIGLCDATTDSELSIRQLELTPNTSENSFRINPNNMQQKYSKESIDSGCQNEHIRCDDDTWRHCDLNIVDITKHISSNNNNDNSNKKKDTLDLAVNCRKSSSSTLSDASSCGTNRSATSSTSDQRKRKDSPKYHSAVKGRFHKDASVSRSKSFQEQDVRKSNQARFYISSRGMRHNDAFNDDYKLSKTISHHNIEITIEDTDASATPLINHKSVATPKPSGKIKANYCSAPLNSSDLNYERHHHKIRSGHILSRIFRRMRKFSMPWRKSKNKSRTRARSISEEFSSGDAARLRDEEYASRPECSGSGSHSRTESTHKSDKGDNKRDREKEERDEETIKVFDGNLSLRRRIFRAITVPRQCTLEQLLTTSLRAFHITRDPNAFYLTDLYALGNEEVRVQDPHPVLNLHRIEGKRPAIFLRFLDENDNGFVRVYPGKLQLQIEDAFVNVPVDNETTVNDLVRDALNRFGLQDNKIEDYRCSEVLLDRGVSERILSLSEQPWQIMKQLGKDSIRQMELMRFYLQHKQDPHGPNIALFIGNLPQALSQRNYEQIITKYTTEENKYSSIGPIYYEYGSVVITFENAAKAVRAFYNLRETIVEEKKLQVLLLPNIEPSMVPAGVQPLLVFVNVKSGGCQGLELISNFRKLLNPYQVFDLDNGGPLPGLYVFRHIKDYRILVCGGDGTIGWVLQCLDNVGQDSECSSPPCAIVPLGTGNDLARVLRWGPGYTGGEDPLNLLRDVIDADEIRLDRWTVVFHPEDKPEDAAQKAPPSAGKKKKQVHQAQPSQQNQHQTPAIPSNNQPQVTGATQSEDNSQILVMNNYFGIGIDADLCLDFHNAREENPNKFNSRIHNKGVYFKMGLRRMVGRKIVKELHKELRLEVDGKVVDLPPVEGIIILNILSWGSGANPWGPEKEDQFSKPNHWDGMLEVVGVTGVVHLGQIQSGLRSAIRIAQGGHIKIHSHSDIPVQVDGEPWIQPPGEVVVFNSALKATMLKKIKSKRRLTEPHISPAVTGAAPMLPENGDRDKDHAGT